MNAFNFLTTDRPMGKTMVLDKGLGLNEVTDLIAVAGAHISFVKFGWGTSAVSDRNLIQQKVAAYNAAGITTYPGGTLLEVAVLQGKYAEYLNEARAIGFTGIEVSDGSTVIDAVTRGELIKQARDAGFFVISEVGKKNPDLDHELTPTERLAMIQADLDHGAHYVILEAREAGKNIGIYDANGQIIDDELKVLAQAGVEHLIIEAPLKAQQVALVLKYGPAVNLGNIATEDAISVATIRRGLRGDTVGKV
ncbi:phosphosulfolactate synthase [Secundilactobacillus odoratitofui DSM 19909 = JCM 15043]|uniref:Phosphosulfolactate synthase n=1 Tax=Secundilactobacillus odoratitofui DSM 19909 = JCM 15043 TaxID=1423776 RepID=A0A0R1LT27_9LACO|nr:phosphosulfolactate synthase [Secundilactobacillus odoratitofui]KRK98965.1 phosphosulfolactate synthase [Secundilactobacillus odoratitofui DSM 19909 = JCM 15043]